jgi:hypothetical protein
LAQFEFFGMVTELATGHKNLARAKGQNAAVKPFYAMDILCLPCGRYRLRDDNGRGFRRL